MGTFNLLPEFRFGRPQFTQNHQISPSFYIGFSLAGLNNCEWRSELRMSGYRKIVASLG